MEKQTTTGNGQGRCTTIVYIIFTYGIMYSFVVIWILVVAVFVFERSIQHDFESREHDIPMYGDANEWGMDCLVIQAPKT
jgi:hypothetical protein